MSARNNHPRCLQAANAIVGEGPSWDNRIGALWWVDIKRPAVFRWDPDHGQTGHWMMPRSVGCAVPAGAGRLAFVDADGFGFLDVQSGGLERIGDPEHHLPQNRFNDGKVDRAGRFWASTMDDNCVQATGSLYRLNRDRSIQRLDTGFICPNGLGWSPDNRTMYFTDSMLRTIWRYDFDFATGALGERRVFARLADDDGVPDGLTVDSEGFVWSAIWGGWRVVRYAPDGTIEREIRMPVQQPSSCMFGGPDLKTLFITSACEELDAAALRKGPLAGGLFALQTEVEGIAEVEFGG